MSGLSIQMLAKDAVEVVALSGYGVQGRAHLEMLAELFGLPEVRIFEAVPEVANRAAEESAGRLPVRVRAGIEDAVHGADVVMTPVAERVEAMGAVVELGWVKSRALALPLANDSAGPPRRSSVRIRPSATTSPSSIRSSSAMR